jgi:hypothetical protein
MELIAFTIRVFQILEEKVRLIRIAKRVSMFDRIVEALPRLDVEPGPCKNNYH